MLAVSKQHKDSKSVDSSGCDDESTDVPLDYRKLQFQAVSSFLFVSICQIEGSRAVSSPSAQQLRLIGPAIMWPTMFDIVSGQ